MKRSAALSVAIVAASARAALAQSSEPAPGVALTPGLLQATLGLAMVLALIWGAAWLIRRMAPLAGASHALIKVVATQAVGQRERVVLVEVADQWLLLGVAPGRVNTLQTLPKSELPASSTPAHPFGRLLARAKREG